MSTTINPDVGLTSIISYDFVTGSTITASTLASMTTGYSQPLANVTPPVVFDPIRDDYTEIGRAHV